MQSFRQLGLICSGMTSIADHLLKMGGWFSDTWERAWQKSTFVSVPCKLVNTYSDPAKSQLLFSMFKRFWTDQKRDQTQQKSDDIHAKMEADRGREHIDYAIVETVLETPRVEISYYWDEPGTYNIQHTLVSMLHLPLGLGLGQVPSPPFTIKEVQMGWIRLMWEMAQWHRNMGSMLSFMGVRHAMDLGRIDRGQY
jgi:hypothetical protein